MRHLQSFKYVKLIAEIGSIRGAAESCAISPSALNRHIQNLELDIGIKIFDRLNVGVRLSTEGELFYQFALLQLRGIERLQSQINDIKGLQTGIIRLGVSAELNGVFINNQIAEFQKEYPQISIQIKVMPKGKAKGFKKSMLTLRDSVLGDYYVTQDDTQYTLMKDGNTIPLGYFSSLRGALSKVSKLRMVEENSEQEFTIQEYLNNYSDISEEIVNKFRS